VPGRSLNSDVDTQAMQVIFRDCLGAAWDTLPEAVRDTHGVYDERRLTGVSSVQRGTTFIAKCLAIVFRFPKATDSIAVSVLKRKTASGEVWIRDFDGQQFQSTVSLRLDETRGRSCVREKFGLILFELGLHVANDAMHLPVVKGWIAGIPIPSILLPVSIAKEYEKLGKMHFDVRIELPFSLGFLVHYRGYLSDAKA